MDQDQNSSFRQHLCSLALQLYLSAETPWVHKKKTTTVTCHTKASTHVLRQSLLATEKQPMAWPGPLQQCSLLFWLMMGSSNTTVVGILIFIRLSKMKRRGTGNCSASSRGLLCHHCWIIYPTSPSMASQEEERERIVTGKIWQERGKLLHFRNLSFDFWSSQKGRNMVHLQVHNCKT